METIGFVGVGKIGLPISENLIKSGYRVVGFRRSSLADFEKIGGVPAKSAADVGALLSEVLRVRYFPLRVQSLCSYHGIPAMQLLAQPPELITALVHRLALADRGEKVGTVLYPDPPLGSEELRLLHEFDPDLDPVTPMTLLAS